MLIDSFMFFNELDLLEYRLNVLNDIVDYFVIVEATVTHSGKPKKLFFDENKNRFLKFSSKIIHIIINDLEKETPTSKPDAFVNEGYNRECIRVGIDVIKKKHPSRELNQNDWIMISDVDEIPNPEIAAIIKGTNSVEGYTLEQDLYYYNLRTKCDIKWYSARIVNYKYYADNLNGSPQRCRIEHIPKIIAKGGWHLSYFGDSQFIKTKIESFCEQSYNTSDNTNINNIDHRVKNQKDVYGRDCKLINIQIEDNDNLPPKCDKFLARFM